MGKRRKTAKTGDKALYGAAASQTAKTEKPLGQNSGEDEIDSFHRERDQDYINLETGIKSTSSDNEIEPSNHAVMDLGAFVESESSEESGDDIDSISSTGKNQKNLSDGSGGERSSDESSSSSDSEGNFSNTLSEDPRSWGRKKSSYYHGDTGDLELGQDEDDAFVEEEAAQEVQESRFKQMEEDDFVLSESEDEEIDMVEGQSRGEMTAVRELDRYSLKEKRKMMVKQHPELVPLLSYFSKTVEQTRTKTRSATSALTKDSAKSVGATLKGQEYLLSKSLLENSMALNTVMLLLLKSKINAEVGKNNRQTEAADPTFQTHPVMRHLQRCNDLGSVFEGILGNRKQDVDRQLESLAKAAELMTEPDGSHSVDSSNLLESEVKEDLCHEKPYLHELKPDHAAMNIDADGNEKVDKNDRSERVKNEARFGLRPSELSKSLAKPMKRKLPGVMSDFGDLHNSNMQPVSFVSTINAIQQRSSKGRKKQHETVEELFEPNDEENQVAAGLKMMEEELGKLGSDDEDEVDNPNILTSKQIENEPSSGFYEAVERKSKELTARKRSRYEVAPKFPGQEIEISGERAISRAIMKNRGLVAHKSKLNRNPRVKKREQYRKALIRRKGAVREVRTGEGHQYGGEGTGIKSGISRSRKLHS